METKTPKDIIEETLSEQGSANVKYLSSISGATEEKVVSIVRLLVKEGKAIYHADMQEGGAPLAEWKGT
ncbi:MAG: hypothetical protein GTN36_00870 [Candidatus Aenigmarchaeota archaeon]|nr:hypothetical protein [Candidatus Aenigmarchaeota archaeon]